MTQPTKPKSKRPRRPADQDADELPPLAYTLPAEPRMGEEPLSRVPAAPGLATVPRLRGGLPPRPRA